MNKRVNEQHKENKRTHPPAGDAGNQQEVGSPEEPRWYRPQVEAAGLPLYFYMLMTRPKRQLPATSLLHRAKMSRRSREGGKCRGAGAYERERERVYHLYLEKWLSAYVARDTGKVLKGLWKSNDAPRLEDKRTQRSAETTRESAASPGEESSKS